MDYLKAFIVGGLLCVIGQILIDKTQLTPGRILVLFVVTGAVLGGLGIYQPIVEKKLFDTLVILNPDKSWTTERM